MNILPAAEKNILDFIANRLLYTSAIPHKYESVKIIAICNHTEFSANGKSVIESGWNQVAAKTSEDKENAKTLPPVSEEQQFFVDELGESAITVGLRAWVATENYWPVKWKMNERIKEEFDAAGISIPYNQLDVHICPEPANKKAGKGDK